MSTLAYISLDALPPHPQLAILICSFSSLLFVDSPPRDVRKIPLGNIAIMDINCLPIKQAT